LPKMKEKLSKHVQVKVINTSIKERRQKRIDRSSSALDAPPSTDYHCISKGISELGNELDSSEDSSDTYINTSDDSKTDYSIPNVGRAVIGISVVSSYAQDHDPAKDNQHRKPVKDYQDRKSNECLPDDSIMNQRLLLAHHADESTIDDLSYDTSSASSNTLDASDNNPTTKQKMKPRKRSSPKQLPILSQTQTHRMPMLIHEPTLDNDKNTSVSSDPTPLSTTNTLASTRSHLDLDTHRVPQQQTRMVMHHLGHK